MIFKILCDPTFSTSAMFYSKVSPHAVDAVDKRISLQQDQGYLKLDFHWNYFSWYSIEMCLKYLHYIHFHALPIQGMRKIFFSQDEPLVLRMESLHPTWESNFSPSSLDRLQNCLSSPDKLLESGETQQCADQTGHSTSSVSCVQCSSAFNTIQVIQYNSCITHWKYWTSIWLKSILMFPNLRVAPWSV